MDIGQTWNWLVVDPLAAALQQLAASTGSSGLAIILFAVFKSVVFSLSRLPDEMRRNRCYRLAHSLSPEIEAVRAQDAEDAERRGSEVNRFYKEHGLWYKPTTLSYLSGWIMFLIGTSLTIGLYSVLTRPEGQGSFDQPFLWLCSLARPDYLRGSCDPLAVIGAFGLPLPRPLPFLYLVTSCISSFVSVRPALVIGESARLLSSLTRGCGSIALVVFLVLGSLLPAGFVLYWLTGTLVHTVVLLVASRGLPPRPLIFDYD